MTLQALRLLPRAPLGTTAAGLGIVMSKDELLNCIATLRNCGSTLSNPISRWEAGKWWGVKFVERLSYLSWVLNVGGWSFMSLHWFNDPPLNSLVYIIVVVMSSYSFLGHLQLLSPWESSTTNFGKWISKYPRIINLSSCVLSSLHWSCSAKPWKPMVCLAGKFIAQQSKLCRQ